MAKVDPQPRAASEAGDGTDGTPGEPAAKHGNRWIWVSAVLALAVVGLLIWGVSTQADLNRTENDVSDLEAQVSNENAESEAAKDVAGDLAQDLDATNEDLAATEQKLGQAEQSEAKAEADAAAAKKDAGQAKNATEKAEADAKQAKAEADAAQSKTEIAGACAQAYVGAFASLFEGDSVKSQAEVVRKELQSISAQCQKARSDE